MVAPSQGVHLVLDGSFLSGDTAIMVPRTSDGRVLFAIPWHGSVVVGTTDTPIEDVSLEPVAMEEEISFILETAATYLQRDPTRDDVRSVFVGIRPLVKASEFSNTAALSREHSIHISSSGLLTIVGGKWTTYRRMAADAVNHAVMLGELDEQSCVTGDLKISGYKEGADVADPLAVYGSEAASVQNHGRELLHAGLSLTDGHVRFAVENEMARTVDDVLARRTRSLLLNAKASIEASAQVAKIMSSLLQTNIQAESFASLASRYTLSS